MFDGSTFFVSAASGDVDARDEPDGFFRADTRHLSRWCLFVDGEPLRILSSNTLDDRSARVFGTLASARVGENPPLMVSRSRFIAAGVIEDLVVENHSEDARTVAVELQFGADFADVFEVKSRAVRPRKIETTVEERRVTMLYERDGFSRGTRLVFEQPCDLDARRARFELALARRERWESRVEIVCLADGEVVAPPATPARGAATTPRWASGSEPFPRFARSGWEDPSPVLEDSSPDVRLTYEQSLADLGALRFRPVPDEPDEVVAAGLPWFMALFGRDSLLAAYEALPFQPRLARSTLRVLARFQATARDDFRDAEPGKFPHELRHGELTAFGEEPHSPYYGSHDATPLYLVVLDEYVRWSGDIALARELEAPARAALTWIDTDADPDGDGFLEYATRSPRGLDNQCWKDSWNAIRFTDGRLAHGPIAVCEIQGYAYDARVRAARLARVAWGDAPLAERLEAAAAEMKARFQRDFWSEARGHYVLALDGKKEQVDSMTSNVGHLLWSGIVPDEHAQATVARLMERDMFTGWGIRTMSSEDAGYNPIAYHNGSVWPHDTAIVAEGMRRYGFYDEAAAVVGGLLDAAAEFGYRMPELLAGLPRPESVLPVDYPTASRPQAWTAGACLLLLRTLFGLDVVDGELRADPHIPARLGTPSLRGVHTPRGAVDVAGVGPLQER